MIKSRWLRLFTKRTIKSLAAALASTPFDVDTGVGFEMLYRNSRRLSAKFIERMVDFEEITDPFGVVTSVQTTRYSSTLFHVYEGNDSRGHGLLLQVISPPRSLRTLIRCIDDIVGDISVAELKIDLFAFFLKIRESSSSACLTKIKASSLRLTKTSEMRVELISGNGMAYEDFTKSFSGSGHSIDKIRVENPFQESRGSIELSTNGTLAMDEDLNEELQNFLLEHLTTG